MNIAPIAILLVEDSPSDAALLQETLNAVGADQFQFTHVETLGAARARLGEQRFDVLLLDLSLPDSAGQETFLRARAAAPQLPIVVLTGASDEEAGLDAVRRGIQDYLVKGQTDGRQVARAILYAIERKRAEERNRLQAHMLDAVGQVVIATDLNQSITYWNQAAAKLFGWPPKTVLGRNLAAITRPQTTPEQHAEILATLRRGETWTGEITCRRKDGTLVSLLTTNSPVLCDVGQPVGIIGVGVDLTERKRAEAELRAARDALELRVAERTADLKQTVEVLQMEIGQRTQAEQALRESEERYRTLFESAPVGIAISSYKGEAIAFNRHLCTMADVTREEARTLPASSFYALPGQCRQLLAQVRKHGKVEQCETLLRRKNGTTFPGLLYMEELRLGRKKVLMTMAQDITKQKQTERHVEGVRRLLELFATKASRQDYAESVVQLLRDWSGCRCAGLRLVDEQGRMPYTASAGYSRRFLRKESRLCLGQADCVCLRLFGDQARAEDLEFRSDKGSFFCNRASQFSARLGVGRAECAKLPCLEARYESLAHAPIRYQGKLLGTIHLADRRPGRFPAETITFIESIAPLVGEALHRFQVEESLQESEQRFRSLFERHEAVMLLVEPQSGAIEDANSAASAFYGYPRERLRVMKVGDLNALPPRLVAAQRDRALRGDRSYFVFPHRLASGEVRTVEVHSSPIRIKGRLLLFSIIHDITERNLLEKQILDISEQERQRLGQDLHDSLGGHLTGVALMGKALAQRLASKSAPEATVAEEIVRCVNESISQTRAIARGLCPVELSATGLLSALREFAAETAQRFHVSCRFQADKGILIQNASAASHLFRIVQEAVHNAIRHGEARTIGIRLAKAGDQIALEIQDDGTGLPTRLPTTKGMGLRTMKYRADTIGAEFAVNRRDGKGTVVSCLLPIERAPNKRTKLCQ
jgi:PAS domain S-box-containing protein